MSALSSNDLRAVLDLVYELNSDDSWTADPASWLLAALGRLVGADVTSYIRVDYRTAQLTGAVVEPAEQNMSGSAELTAAFDQHPGLAAYRTGQLRLGRAAALSDFAASRELRKLQLYTDFYLPRGTVDQLLCMVTRDRRHSTTLALNRSRWGFTDRERAILDVLTPHLAQAVANRARVAELTSALRRLSRQATQLNLALAELPDLTRAERAVVEHVADGLTDRDIALSLAISPRTVQKHLENIYRKLGISSRSSLIALMSRAAATSENAP